MSFDVISKVTDSIPSDEGLPIRYDLYVPSGKPELSVPVVLFLHGFKGFKDWGPFPAACEALSEAGFGVLAMNFSHNGVGEDPLSFDRLDLFEKETLSRDLADVGRVIRALREGDMASDKANLDTGRIGLLGHSRGGHTAIAAAAEFDEVSCLVTWSAVADYNARWTDEMIRDWEEKGVTEIKNGRTGQMMPVGSVVYHDARENADRLMAVERVKELHIPALFIHARDDDSVPPGEAEKLKRNCPSQEAEMRLVAGTGHTFGGSHPFEGDDFPEPFGRVLGETIRWFEYYMQ